MGLGKLFWGHLGTDESLLLWQLSADHVLRRGEGSKTSGKDSKR